MDFDFKMEYCFSSTNYTKLKSSNWLFDFKMFQSFVGGFVGGGGCGSGGGGVLFSFSFFFSFSL